MIRILRVQTYSNLHINSHFWQLDLRFMILEKIKILCARPTNLIDWIKMFIRSLRKIRDALTPDRRNRLFRSLSIHLTNHNILYILSNMAYEACKYVMHNLITSHLKIKNSTSDCAQIFVQIIIPDKKCHMKQITCPQSSKGSRQLNNRTLYKHVEFVSIIK